MVTSIQLTLTGAQASAKVDGLLTSGMVGVPVTIQWDESWEGLRKTLVCRSDGCIRSILDVGRETTVAPEVFRTEKWAPNALYLGVEGRDEDGKLVIPSTFAYCGQILPGAMADGPPSREGENPIWLQILQRIGDLQALKTAQRDSLVGAINEAFTQASAEHTDEISVAAGYQLADSGTQVPGGTWQETVPQMVPGQYLWTRLTISQEGGAPKTVFIVSSVGAEQVLSGGGVASVNQVLPDANGNVALTAEQIGALPLTGGTMTGALSLVSPTAAVHGATKGYVDNALSAVEATAATSERGKKKFVNIAVAATDFVADSTYADYPYRAAIALSGVTASMIPEVVLPVAALMERSFAPVAACYSGGVYIYADGKPSGTITIPTIFCWR